MNRLDALLQTQVLDRMPRTGWIQQRVPEPESVCAHSFGAALVVLTLGPEVEPALDVDRAVTLALLHDVGEARTGDLPRSAAGLFPAGVKAAAERAAVEELLGPLSSLARERALEALAKESREARFVAKCEVLQLGVRLVAYLRSGVRDLDQFRDGIDALDCSEFEPCEAFRREIQGALERLL